MSPETTTTPQPPPGVEAPPPGPEAVRSRNVLRLILFIGGGSILLLYLMMPVVLRSRKSTERTEAVNNLKQIGLALHDFEADYGSFPDASTIAAVKKATGTTWTLGSGSSNQLYRQMTVTGLRSEKPFYARTSWTRKPDDVVYDEAHALAPGEVASAYIAGLSTASPPSTPVAVLPLKPGSLTFEKPGCYGDKAMTLRCDGSVFAIAIDAGGNAVSGGVYLFDPSRPYWNGKVPDVKWPELP